ncbi:MAG TPA: hypothetical protein VEX40_16135 [Mycobacterium sp.]|nr:hypothetical protein [Mycobacterium sp.]
MPTAEEAAEMAIAEPRSTTAATAITARQVSIVCQALGVPRDDWLLFWRWTDELSNPKTLDAMRTYIDVMIADRCRQPADDLLSKLIELEVDGEELTVDDIHRFVATLVAGAG